MPKPVQASSPAPIKDKQVGKDDKGHVVYQDKKEQKYYMDEKGVKVNVTKSSSKQQWQESCWTHVKQN